MKNFLNKLKAICSQNKTAVGLLAAGFVVVIIVVSVTVALVPGSKLTRIEIASPPVKTRYIEKQLLDPTGLEVVAFYGKNRVPITDYTLDKSELHKEDKQVTVSFTDGGITETASFDITVAIKSLLSIEISSPPSKSEYVEGAFFEPDGITVTACYDNGERDAVTGWDYDKKTALGIADERVTVTYCGLSASVGITVNPKLLKSISIARLPYRSTYTAGEYFDFLGLEIRAEYDNAQGETVAAWDYDKKDPLTVADTCVEISYSLHGVTETATIAVSVAPAPPRKPPEQERVDSVLSVLPPAEKLTAQNLSAIEYALSLLGGLADPTREQSELMDKLERRRSEIAEGLPSPAPEPEYIVSYAVEGGLVFADIDYGDNPVKYKNSSGEVLLADAYSQTAADTGYEFRGWSIGGRRVTAIENATADLTVYAVFEPTATTDIVFKDYIDGAELLTLRSVSRTADYDFDGNRTDASIYSASGLLPVAYYSAERERIRSADLSIGKTITVYALVAQARELHLISGNNATVGWTYAFTVGASVEQTIKPSNVGTVFVAPIGSVVTIMSTHANIDDILVDGVAKGERVNNTAVKAEFVLESGEYPVSVSFETVLSGAATLSFVGYNSHSVLYPSGWNGFIADVDMDTIAFIYDEASDVYLNTYTIDGVVYYFDDLASYRFGGDTQIRVNRVVNSFSFTVVYGNGTESFDDIAGKRSLRAALGEIDAEALETLNSILADDRLYTDPDKRDAVSKETVLSAILRGDVTVYSDWLRPAPQPMSPVFAPVDYGECDFVNTWTATFMRGGDVLSSELVLAADGTYAYATTVNGALSVTVGGVYRIENGAVVIKTLQTGGDGLVTASDISIDIAFVMDGLLVADFVDLRGTVKTVFSHTLASGGVRPINYTGREFVGTYELDVGTIALRENGTAVITSDGIESTAYYRVTEDGKVYIFENGTIGTGEIILISESLIGR